MGDAILFNKSMPNNKSYDWNIAFNNDEFINYIKYAAFPSYYTGYEDEIADNAYSGITKLYSATFPSCYKRVGAHAFENCQSLSYVGFSNTSKIYDENNNPIAQEIGERAFANCPNLYEVSFGTTRIIGKQAFLNCSTLRLLSFQSSMIGLPTVSKWMNSIDDEAFLGCYMPRTFTLRYLNRIGKRAFEGCTINDGDWYLGESICRIIDDEAFANCKYIFTPKFNYLGYQSRSSGITLSLGSHIFEGCSSITRISVYGLITDITSETFGDLRSTLDHFYCSINSVHAGFSEYRISLQPHAFDGYSKLTDVEMQYVKYIGDYAFYGCDKLMKWNIEIGTSICGGIGAYAFANCSKITEFEHINEVGYVYGVSLSYIGSHAFDGCTSLYSINFNKLSTVPVLESIDAFDNIVSDYTIYVPSSLYSNFINDPVWGLISSHISR